MSEEKKTLCVDHWVNLQSSITVPGDTPRDRLDTDIRSSLMGALKAVHRWVEQMGTEKLAEYLIDRQLVVSTVHEEIPSVDQSACQLCLLLVEQAHVHWAAGDLAAGKAAE